MARKRGLRPNGPAIRRLRIERGMEAADLAGRIGRPRGTLYDIEGERNRISEVYAYQIARALTAAEPSSPVTVEDITREDDAEPEALAS